MKQLNSDREGAFRFRRNDREGPGELIPGRQEGEDDGRRQRGPGQRHRKAPVAGPHVRAINLHGLVELARDPLEEAAQQEGVERQISRHVEQHEGPQVIDEVQLLGEHELRDDQHHRRNHEAEEQGAEKPLLAREIEARERVGHHRGEPHGQHRRSHGHERRIQGISGKILRRPCLHKVVDRARVGDELRGRLQDVGLRLEGRRHHVGEGQDHDDCAHRQDDEAQRRSRGANRLTRRAHAPALSSSRFNTLS